MRTRSQNDHLICYMATGKPVTPMVALRRWGIFRLGARIWDLKQQGHQFNTRTVKRSGARVAEYRLILH